MSLSQLILDRFHNSGLSKYRLSKESGVSESTISRWVGGGEIGLSKFEKIAKALDCELVYFFNGQLNQTIIQGESR